MNKNYQIDIYATCVFCLLSGEYELAIRRNNDALSEFRQNIYVYEGRSPPTMSIATWSGGSLMIIYAEPF